MALGATIYTVDVTLADTDRGVYEDLPLRIALHPSESVEYMVTRLLAYCLEYGEGIGFGKGIAEADEPPVWLREPDGRVRTWIEVGAPDADRLHRAAKLAERVAIYTHRDPAMLQRNWAGKRIHRAAEIGFYTFDRGFVAELAERLERRSSLTLTVTEGQLYVDLAGANLTSAVTAHPVQP
ncbi:MAG TPA: YaeQ family protein [Herpetosiphonaceae bacterium]